MARYVGYIYITDDNKPNPYDTVSSSFVDLVALLDTCPESPISGDWTISSNCSLTTNTIAPGNVTVQNGAVVTIPSGKSLNIDFSHHKLLIKAGSGVLIKSGGRISSVP